MWRGLAAPAGTPAKVVKVLETAAMKAVNSERFTQAAANIGFSKAFLGADDFGKVIASDDAFYGDLLSHLGMAK
jgi:tripartite-type tricarboxylate transporter receptor subunit TctC